MHNIPRGGIRTYNLVHVLVGRGEKKNIYIVNISPQTKRGENERGRGSFWSKNCFHLKVTIVRLLKRSYFQTYIFYGCCGHNNENKYQINTAVYIYIIQLLKSENKLRVTRNFVFLLLLSLRQYSLFQKHLLKCFLRETLINLNVVQQSLHFKVLDTVKYCIISYYNSILIYRC